MGNGTKIDIVKVKIFKSSRHIHIQKCSKNPPQNLVQSDGLPIMYNPFDIFLSYLHFTEEEERLNINNNSIRSSRQVKTMASTEPKPELDLDGITDENVLQQMVSCSFFFFFFFFFPSFFFWF